MMFDGLELRILLCDYLLLKMWAEGDDYADDDAIAFLRPFESFFMNHYDGKLNLLSV